MMPSIGGEDMGSTLRPNINHILAVDILVDFAGIFPVLESFRCWAIILLVSLLPVFRALRHAPNLPMRIFCLL